MPATTVRIVDHDGERVAELGERLDVFSSSSLVNRVFASMPHDARRIVLDLRKLKFVDSAGASALMRLSERARGSAVDVYARFGRTTRLSPTVQSLLRRVLPGDDERH